MTQEMHSDRLVFPATFMTSQVDDTERDDDYKDGAEHHTKDYVENASTCVRIVTYRHHQ